LKKRGGFFFIINIDQLQHKKILSNNKTCADQGNHRGADCTRIAYSTTSSETGRINTSITIELGIWNNRHRLGVVFDSSTGLHLSNGADRSPDTSWILKERWDALPVEQKGKFAPITPDFVLELRSSDERTNDLRLKMDEYMACGVRLGWLVNPSNKCTIYIRRMALFKRCHLKRRLPEKQYLPAFCSVWLIFSDESH
jgi:Uma2 family endonuclease